MSQNSEQIESKLCAYIDGELDEKDRADIEKHLIAHPHHRHLLKELAETRRLLRLLPRETAPAELAESFQGQLERSVLLNDPIEEDIASASPLRINRLAQYLAAAAVVVLAAGLGLVVYFALPEPHPVNVAAGNPSHSTALSADQKKLVETLGSRDAGYKGRDAIQDGAEVATPLNGARPDAQGRNPALTAADKSAAAMETQTADTATTEDVAPALGIASARRAADDLANGAESKPAADDSETREPLVIVVSSTDPQKARQEAADYLEQLGVRSRALAPDWMTGQQDEGDARPLKDGTGGEPPDRDAVLLYAQAKRAIIRQDFRVDREAAKQVAAPSGQAMKGDDRSPPLPLSVATAATKPGAGVGGLPVAAASTRDEYGKSNALNDSVATGRGMADKLEKKASARVVPRADAAMKPVAAASASPPAPPSAPGANGIAAPLNADSGQGRSTDQALVAQDVTREQIALLRESFEAGDDASRVHVVGDASLADEQERSRVYRRKGASSQPATDAALLGSEKGRMGDGAPSSRPAAIAMADSASPPAAQSLQQRKSTPPKVVGAPVVSPSTVPTAAASAPLRKVAATLPSRVRPGERLRISVKRSSGDAEKIDEEVTVADEGSIYLPEQKVVQAGGASLAQIESKIAQAYRENVASVEIPLVTVTRVAATRPTAPLPQTRAATLARTTTAPSRHGGGTLPLKDGATPVARPSTAEPADVRSEASSVGERPPAVRSPSVATLPTQRDVVIVFRKADAARPSTMPINTPASGATLPAIDSTTKAAAETGGENSSVGTQPPAN